VATPNSSSTPYCSPQQYCNLYDIRTTARMLSDAGTQLSTTDTQNSPVLLQFLQSASGELEAKCTVASNYSPQDLASLTGNSAQFLADIVAGVAFFKMWCRRPEADIKIPMQCRLAMEHMKELENGSMIFGILEHAQAGTLDYIDEDWRDVENRNMSTRITRRWLGRRSNQYRYQNSLGGDGDDWVPPLED
jgi:hypothetical protein